MADNKPTVKTPPRHADAVLINAATVLVSAWHDASHRPMLLAGLAGYADRAQGDHPYIGPLVRAAKALVRADQDDDQPAWSSARVELDRALVAVALWRLGDLTEKDAKHAGQ